MATQLPTENPNLYLEEGECGHDRLCERCNAREVSLHEIFVEISSQAASLIAVLEPALKRVRSREPREATSPLTPLQELELARAAALVIQRQAEDEGDETCCHRHEFIKGKNAKLVRGGSIVRYRGLVSAG